MELVGEEGGVGDGIGWLRGVGCTQKMKPMKHAVEGLGLDGLLVTELVAELYGDGSGLFVEFERRGRHGNS